MQQILEKISVFTSKYKGILVILDNKELIYFTILENAIPHLLGLQKIKSLYNKPPSIIMKNIKSGKISNRKISNDRKIPKNIKRTIANKNKAINILINNYKDTDNVFVYKKISYKNYKSDFVIKIQNAILCLEINKKNPNFYNCHLKSIRFIGLNSQENNLYLDEYSKISKIKWSKK